MAHPRPFKVWRQPPGGADMVFAEGTVADDGALAVTSIDAPFKLPKPGEKLTLTELEAHLANAQATGFKFRVELGDQIEPEPDPEPDGRRS